MIISILAWAVLSLTLAAAFCDLKSLKIPNILCLAILGLWIVGCVILCVTAGWDTSKSFLLSGLLTGGLAFGVGFIAFALNIMGAGDAKLFAVLGLWTGFTGFLLLLIWTALAGGLLGALALYFKKSPGLTAKLAPRFGWFHALHTGRNAVPYGVAIFVGTFASFLKSGLLTF